MILLYLLCFYAEELFTWGLKPYANLAGLVGTYCFCSWTAVHKARVVESHPGGACRSSTCIMTRPEGKEETGGKALFG